MKLFGRKTPEQKHEQKKEKRVSELLSVLLNDYEETFSELETVQILNDFRRKTAEILKNRKSECLSKSTELQQKASEIQEALNILEN